MAADAGTTLNSVPAVRIRTVADRPVRPERAFVLYWMIAHRRLGWNFALQRAVDLAVEHRRPLVILEPLRCGYRWASDRFHRFVLEGMAEHDARAERRGVTYYPYAEPTPGAGRGLLETLSLHAVAVVTDDYPEFFLPAMVAAAGRRLDLRLEAVDSNGLLPMRAADRAYPTAYAFRRFLQKSLPVHFHELPERDPLARVPRLASAALPDEVVRRWPRVDPAAFADLSGLVAALPIDHAVGPAAMRGGSAAGSRVLEDFLDRRLARYADDRNQPDVEAASGLSPWLHFGHVSPHEVFASLAARENWSPLGIRERSDGSREGWWGMSRNAESFLDELVTWREVGFNMASLRDDHDRYESLPDWAKRTLAEHAADPREHLYSLDELDQARTHDALWNAAQTQLVREGRMHNYLRMLWGKKVLEWSASPEDALASLVELNNKYAVDGRDPNSYSGIFWVFGRYDRPWAPVRPIFGSIRYMSSANTARKLRVREYLRTYTG